MNKIIKSLSAMQPRKLDRLELKKFGWIMCLGFTFFIGLLIPLIFHKSFHAWPFVISGIFIFFSYFSPGALRLIYVPWMFLSSIIGFINTRILLFIVFYFVITPIAIILDLIGKDAMQRQLQVETHSYRKRRAESDSQHMERMF